MQNIESNRDGEIAVDDGHSYNQKQTSNNCIHWPGAKHYKLKCPAIFETKNEIVIDTKGIHNQDWDPGKCRAKEAVNQIGRKDQYSTPVVAMANEITEIWDNYAVQLAMRKKDNLLRAVSQKQQKEICLQLPAPTD